MTRLVQRRATRGSQRWLQEMVGASDPRLEGPLLNTIGARSLDWKSPLAQDDFAEYRDDSFLEVLGLEPRSVPLSTHWPRRGPVWDGLAVADTGTRVLVESKAHPAEMTSSMAASSPDSIALITRSLSDTAAAVGTGITPAWTAGYYQYANRLAHLRFLRHLSGVDAVLAFVYFIGDDDIGGPASVEAWRASIDAAKAALGLAGPIDGVVELMVSVR